MLRLLYNLLFPAAFLLLLPGYIRRMMRRGNYRRAFGQRFGLYEKRAQGKPRLWIQAVSVGEMLAALKLVGALRERDPGLSLILSTTTTTGYQLALDRAGPGVQVVYTPIDLLWCVRRAFDALAPSHVAIVDGGLWPNLLWEARRRGVRTSLVNARLSPRSERRWRRFAFVARPIMRMLDLVCVPEAEDVARWRALGVPPDRIHPTGSVKFEDRDPGSSGPARSISADALQSFLGGLGVAAGAPLLLAGSTHPGEERAIAEQFQRLRAQFPDLFLIVAPRHVERSAKILPELESLGLRIASRSAAKSDGPAPDALLLDTTGELRDWYSTATIVFVGKSLCGVGGQNPMEAIAAGKPVIFGPRMDNFRELAAQLVAANAAVQVETAADLETACARLLTDSGARARQAAAASEILAMHHGAALRTADLLLAEPGFSPCQRSTTSR